MTQGAWQAPGVLRGFASGGERVVALVWLSEDGGHVFSCRYHPARGFRWVRRDDLAEQGGFQSGDLLDGVPIERTPLKPVLEELAHAVVAHQRAGEPLPAELQLLVELLSPGSGSPLI